MGRRCLIIRMLLGGCWPVAGLLGLWLLGLPARADECAPYRYLSATEASPPPAAGGFLLAVSPSGVAPSYVLGTLHSVAPEVLAAWSRVALLLGLSGTRVFITERDLDDPGDMARQWLPGTATLAQQLRAAPGLYPRILALLSRYHLPAAAAVHWQPWFAAAVLSQAPARARQPGSEILDAYLLHAARKLALPLHFLEDFAALADAYEHNFSSAGQRRLLWETVCNQVLLRAQIRDQTDAYAADDVAAWWRSLQRYRGSDPALADKLETVFGQRRSDRFWRQLRPAFERGGAVVAIGALHVLGAGGLWQRLQQAHIPVRVVSPASLDLTLSAASLRTLPDWVRHWLAATGWGRFDSSVFRDLRIVPATLPELRRRLCPGLDCTVEATYLPATARVLVEPGLLARLLRSPVTPDYALTASGLQPLATASGSRRIYAESVLVRELVRHALYHRYHAAALTAACLRAAILHQAALAQWVYVRDQGGDPDRVHLFVADPRCPPLMP